MDEQQTTAQEQCDTGAHSWLSVREAMTARQFRTTRSRCSRCRARRTAVLRTDLDEPTVQVTITEGTTSITRLERLGLPPRLEAELAESSEAALALDGELRGLVAAPEVTAR